VGPLLAIGQWPMTLTLHLVVNQLGLALPQKLLELCKNLTDFFLFLGDSFVSVVGSEPFKFKGHVT